MNSEVEKYLQLQEKKEAENRDEFLISLGLYTKVYSPDGERTEEYCECEDVINDDNSVYVRFYKKVPVEVTEEEYQKILQYQKPAENHAKNGVYITLIVTTVIIALIGFILGIVLAKEIEIWVMFVVWGSTYVASLLMVTFSEIIRLLQIISEK